MASPRVPILRTSERRSLKRCPQLWWWAWRCGLVPIGQVATALWFGTGVHIALAAWYCGPGLKRGPLPAETFAKWADDEIHYVKTTERRRETGALAFVEEKMVPGKELGIALLEAYVEHYGRDDSWSVIEPEYSGQVDIMDPLDVKRLLVIYAFTWDLVFRDLADDRIWLGENKTAASIRISHLPLDDQAGSYWLTAQPYLRDKGLIGPRESLAGIMYNFVRKQMPDTRPVNEEGYRTNLPQKADYLRVLQGSAMRPEQLEHMKVNEKATLAHLKSVAELAGITVYGEVSKKQPAPLFVREEVHRTAKERATQYRRIQNEAKLAEWYRSGQLPITKTTTQDCPFCPYFDMCMLDETDEQGARDYRKSMYRSKDPYADHRKSTEE